MRNRPGVVRRRLLAWLGGLALLAALVAYGARSGGGAPDVRGLSDDDAIRASVLAHEFGLIDTIRIEPFGLDHLFRRRSYCVGTFGRTAPLGSGQRFPAAMSLSPKLVSAFSGHYPAVEDAALCGVDRSRDIAEIPSGRRAIMFGLGPVQHSAVDRAQIDVGFTTGPYGEVEKCTVVHRATRWAVDSCTVMGVQ